MKIIDIDLDRRRISLSIKQAAEGGVVAAEYQDQFGEHAYDEHGNYIGPEIEDEAESRRRRGGRAAAEAADAEADDDDADAGARRSEGLAEDDLAAAQPPTRPRSRTPPPRPARGARAPTSLIRPSRPGSSSRSADRRPTIQSGPDREHGRDSRSELVGNRRTLLAAAAIVLAAAAGLGVYFYVSGADKRAENKVQTGRGLRGVPGHPEGHDRRRPRSPTGS